MLACTDILFNLIDVYLAKKCHIIWFDIHEVYKGHLFIQCSTSEMIMWFVKGSNKYIEMIVRM